MYTTFIDLVRSRRSVRKYLKKDIPLSDYQRCIEAAIISPSACNSQPWKFIIINDIATRNLIAKTVFTGPYKMNAFAAKAAGYIAIVSEKIKFSAMLAGIIRNTDFTKIDIGIACSHLSLQAQALNIGTCILGWFNEKKLKKILSVPRTKRIELLLSLGYPEKTDFPKKIMKDPNETYSCNKY